MEKRRVVITGMDTINPLGDSLTGYFDNLIKGKSGVIRWKSLDMSNVECKVGGDIGDYDCMAALTSLKERIGEDKFKSVRKLFKTGTFSGKTAILCSLKAFLDAGLYGEAIDPFRASVLVGGHNLNSRYIFENGLQFLEEPEFIEPLSGVEGIDPNVPAVISETLGLQGPTFTVGGACASGNLAVRDGFRDIITGECDLSVVTGALFDMTAAIIHASVVINAVVVKPEFQDRPEAASRPFDGDRCGFVYSHGAGTLILEEYEHAKKRGARIYGELLGVRATSNASHLPLPSGHTQEKTIKALLADARVAPEEVDYVNCHATGTPSGDQEEITGIKQAFGNHAGKLKLNAAKSMLGHVCWSSPIVETIGGLLQMQHGVLHPTINIDRPDPQIDLDICANRPKEHRITTMLKNSFGFGGINCCTLIRRI
ncbi:MAG TPA: beta-ketoacyl-[acyl-carrier-protein] synthase family protein [Spirochaetia bacterium]|nr:beta-ketoacyl-[acyl-carrier-protein] synthase family protein [Spirochaetia bacterium]